MSPGTRSRGLAAVAGAGSRGMLADVTDIREGGVRLPDRRWVQYTDQGPAGAPVVLYCHGIPGSRHEVAWASSALDGVGTPVRLIAPNRPGYGRSTWTRLPGFAAWTADAAHVLDGLGVGRCAVLGASGGAPFALACAQHLAARVNRVGVVAGVAPPRVAGMDRSAAWLTEPRDPRARVLRYAALAAGYRLGLGRWLEGRLLAALGEADRQALQPAGARATLHRVVVEAFAQRGRAAAHEAGLLLEDWDIDPAQVGVPVRVWHGTRDTRIPVEVSHGLTDLMPGASLEVWPQHGHFSWATSDQVAGIAAYLTGSGG